MAFKILDIKTYTPTPVDSFFFDNNIWMYLFCPLGNYNRNKQSKYSSFLQKVLSSKSIIYINSMVLSEFANSYLRLDFEQWKDQTTNYTANFKKDFICSERYKDTTEVIRIQINRILQNCERITDSFNAIRMEDVLIHFQSIDFNDSYYIELGKTWKWKFVTDDSDFINYKNHNIDVITYF
jgi:predicted nucleic acid-binding protein